ncbi:hypothetical protein FMUND_13512 [Fusarium mundagurra]|uniref:Uncharacterized protein n=1 Tax=Fusarium mundagurra TaxID=1567541 RepID=A0A8H6D3C6_9HYPO|nr:hypothetical protein FMUND_13512 [Fusarium mundagurra]
MSQQRSRKRPIQPDASPEAPPPHKRPHRSGGVEPESIQEQILRLNPETLEKAYEIAEILRDASKMRLEADEEWYKDGGKRRLADSQEDIQLTRIGYEEEEHLATRQRELDVLKTALETRQGFQKGKDISAELDRVETKIRMKREMLRREFDRLAAQARALDMPSLVKLTEHYACGIIGVVRAQEEEGNGEGKEVDE